MPGSGEMFSGLEGRFGAILADPPWRFGNRSARLTPELRRLERGRTMTVGEIAALPAAGLAAPRCHLYLWCPNALLPEGLEVMRAWGFGYKTHLVWYKVRKDGGPDARGAGFYFRTATELLLFGVRGRLRTLAAAQRQVNLIASRKLPQARKPEVIYGLIERCSPGPYCELFGRRPVAGWSRWDGAASARGATRPRARLAAAGAWLFPPPP